MPLPSHITAPTLSHSAPAHRQRLLIGRVSGLIIYSTWFVIQFTQVWCHSGIVHTVVDVVAKSAVPSNECKRPSGMFGCFTKQKLGISFHCPYLKKKRFVLGPISFLLKIVYLLFFKKVICRTLFVKCNKKKINMLLYFEKTITIFF